MSEFKTSSSRSGFFFFFDQTSSSRSGFYSQIYTMFLFQLKILLKYIEI